MSSEEFGKFRSVRAHVTTDPFERLGANGTAVSVRSTADVDRVVALAELSTHGEKFVILPQMRERRRRQLLHTIANAGIVVDECRPDGPAPTPEQQQLSMIAMVAVTGLGIVSRLIGGRTTVHHLRPDVPRRQPDGPEACGRDGPGGIS